jgi:TonB family protein
MKWNTGLLLAGLVPALALIAQQPAAKNGNSPLAPDSMDPAKLLAFATAHNGAGEVPGDGWHIKATFDVLTSAIGTSYTTGTYEETWYAPQNYKRTYTFKGVTHTDIATPDGLYREGDQAWQTPDEERVRTMLVKPLDVALSAGTTLRIKDANFGKIDLPCLYELHSIPAGLKKKDEEQFVDGSPHMCFETNAPILRFMAGIGGHDVIEMSKIANLHGHLVAQEIVVGSGQSSTLKVHVLEAAAVPSPDGPMQPPADAKKLTSPVTVAWETMEENRLPDPAEPEYPAGALQEHTEGDVDVAVVIAPDGTVTSAKLIRGTPLLQEAALAFVRASKFKPFMLSGTPVEVHTTAKITFDAEMAMRQYQQRQ